MDASTSKKPFISFLLSYLGVVLTGSALLSVFHLDNPETWRVAAATAGFVIFAMLCVLSTRAWYFSESASGGTPETLSGA